MTLSILINAATLKGYLLAKEAPAEMVALAQGIVDGSMSAMKPESPGIEEYAPQYFTRPLDAKVAPAAPPGFITNRDLGALARAVSFAHDQEELTTSPPAELPQESVKDANPSPPETANTAPETGPTEANSIPSATEDAKEGNDAPVTTGGAIAKAKQTGNYKTKLEASMLPAIKEALAIESFGTVGAGYGVTGQSIVNFLKRHGVDHRDFKKKTWKRKGNPGKRSEAIAQAAVDEDGWPLAVKSDSSKKPDAPRADSREEAIARVLAAMPPANDKPYAKLTRDDAPKILRLLGDLDINTIGARLNVQANQIDAFLKKYGIDYRTLPPKTSHSETVASEPLVKFETVTVKGSYGLPDREREVPAPVGEYEDPETGAKVTQYPPMYALGAHSPRNARVKGGS